jgi:hypothetical protein
LTVCFGGFDEPKATGLYQDRFPVAGACDVVPPWCSRYRSSFGFLFHPPFGGATVNLTRLFVEWVLIALGTSGFFFSQSKPDSSKPDPTIKADSSRLLAEAQRLGVEVPSAGDLEQDEHPQRDNTTKQWKRKFLIPFIVVFAICAVGLAYYGARRIGRDLPTTENSKLAGGASITNYGRFVWNAYNGSDFVLTEVRVSISVFDEKGNAIISNRVYRVPAFDFYPQQTKELSTDVGFTLGEGQRWEWSTVGARGRPE